MRKRLAVLAAVFCAIALVAGVAGAGIDFGQFVRGQLADQSTRLFGFSGPLEASSTRSITKEQAQADPSDLATVANTALQGPHDNDLWDCLPDGADPDLQSDGCVRMATLNDLTAEWTGGIFDAGGQHFYVSVQHNVSGSGTILDITGWR